MGVGAKLDSDCTHLDLCDCCSV